MKKKFLAVTIVLAVFAGGYSWLRYGVLHTRELKTGKDSIAVSTSAAVKESSPIDLRPAIVTKLQELVRDASHGLYNLSIEKIEPDVIASTLDVTNGRITIDSSALKRLSQSRQLPDDIFSIEFRSLHIDGIGLNDLLNKENIELKGIFLHAPTIHVYHQVEYHYKNPATVYSRLVNQFKKIAVGRINVDKGTIYAHRHDKKGTVNRFNNVSLKMDDLLIDSTSQYDNSRFLLARHALLRTENYTIRTPDSLYYLKMGELLLSGDQRTFTIRNVELQPRGNRRQFAKKLPGRREMFHIKMPKVVFSGVNGWALISKDLVASRADITNATFNIYRDKSLPLGPPLPVNNFPHQLVMKIPFPVTIGELRLRNANLIYEEYNPVDKQSGILRLVNLNGSAYHITNMRAEIKRSPLTTVSATTLISGKTPLSLKFRFDLNKWQSGVFNVDVHVTGLTRDVVNPLAEPLSLMTVKKGEMQKATAVISGDNHNAGGVVTAYYTDLHITPLKTANDDTTKLKSAHLKSFIANLILIKNDNPSGNELRQPSVAVVRAPHQTFTNLVWSAILTGLLKTFGIPPGMIVKPE